MDDFTVKLVLDTLNRIETKLDLKVDKAICENKHETITIKEEISYKKVGLIIGGIQTILTIMTGFILKIAG